MKNCSVFIFLFLLSAISCKKEYQRPQKYEIDLFENEKKDTVTGYIMPKNEAYGISDVVISSSEVSISDSSSGRGKAIYIYKINSGTLLFSKRDSVISYPFYFLADHRLDLKKVNNTSLYVFLEKLQGYSSIAEMKNIKYQWLKGAPVYLLDNNKK